MTEEQQAQIALTQGWLAQGKLVTGLQPGLGNMKFYQPLVLWPCYGAPLAAQEQAEAIAWQAKRQEAGWPALTPVEVIAAGDSITVGAGSIDGLGYRSFLKSKLEQRGFDANIILAGQNGLSMDAVKAAALARISEYPGAKVVVFAAGTNDIAANSPTFQTRYASAIDAILATSSTIKVLAMKIPIPGDWVGSVAWDFTGGNPESWVSYATTINNSISAVANARASTGRVRLGEAVPQGECADGGIHPTSRPGYLRMARTISSVLPDEWLS